MGEVPDTTRREENVQFERGLPREDRTTETDCWFSSNQKAALSKSRDIDSSARLSCPVSSGKAKKDEVSFDASAIYASARRRLRRLTHLPRHQP